MSRTLKRLVQGGIDCLEGWQGSGDDGGVFQRHRRIVGAANSIKRNTGVPGLKRSASASSGVTVPAARFSQMLCGVRPRARMSSEKDVSMAKFLSTRAETKFPAP